MLGRLFLAIVGAGASYALARRLLDNDETIERLPAEAQPRVRQARARLLDARDQAAGVLGTIERERDAAERELIEEYEARVHRSAGVPTSNSTPRPAPWGQ
jgi:hypothetical protein